MAVLVARMSLLVIFTARAVTTGIIIDAHTNTWWEASRNCEQAGGKLFVPETEDDVHLLLNKINDEQFHWIGGFSFISWKWTCDSTAFYKSVCLSEINNKDEVTKRGNSAYKCHQQCGKKFGLQGEHCYCLGTETYKCEDTLTPVMRCKGNFDDFCGSDSLMSVYDVVIEFESVILSTERCVYAKKVERQSMFQLDNCFIYRSMAGYKGNEPDQICDAKVKLTRKLKVWDTWNNETDLLKVTSNNIRTLTTEMKEFDHNNTQTYWIGLRGFLDSRWIFETNMPIPEPEADGVAELCLSVRKASTNSSLMYNWTSCDFSFKPVCRKENLATTIATVPTTRSSGDTSSFSTTNQSTSTAAKSTFSTINPETTTSTSTTTSTVKPSVTSTVTSSLPELSTNAEIVPDTKSNQSSSTGLYVGIPIGMLMIIGAIIVLLLYRQRRICFSKRKDDVLGNPDTGPTFKPPSASDKAVYSTLGESFINPSNASSRYERIGLSGESNELQPLSSYSLASMLESRQRGSNDACYDLSNGHKVKDIPKEAKVKVTKGHKVKNPAVGLNLEHQTKQHKLIKTPVLNKNTENIFTFGTDRRNGTEFEDTYNHIDNNGGNEVLHSKTSDVKAYDHVNNRAGRVAFLSGAGHHTADDTDDVYDHTNIPHNTDDAFDTNYSHIQVADEDCHYDYTHGDNNSTYDRTNIRQENIDASEGIYDRANLGDESVYDHTNIHDDKVGGARNYNQITLRNFDDGDYDVTGVANEPLNDDTYSHVTETDQIYSLATI